MLKKIWTNPHVMRVLTSIVGLPILVFFLYVGGWPLKLALLALVLVGMYEFYTAVSGKLKTVHFAGFVFAVFYYMFLDYLNATNAATILLISFTLALCTLTVVFHKTTTVKDAAVAFFGFCYVGGLLSTVYLTSVGNSPLLVAVVFISAWGCDTGAYFVGRIFGKHKLAPELSPNKTVEGAVGGMITAALLTAILGFVVFQTRAVDISSIVIKFIIIGAVCSVFAQLGDLFASTIKRLMGIKDFGSVLPGHGGVIDRFDSVFFTAPALYLAALLLR